MASGAFHVSSLSRLFRLLSVVLLLCALAPVSAAGVPALPRFHTVVVVLAPYLTWDDVVSGRTPALHALVEASALGCLSVRAGAMEAAPSSLRGAAIVSAGRPVDVRSPDDVPDADGLGALGQAVRDADGLTVALGTSAATPTDALDRYTSEAFVVVQDRDGELGLEETSARVLRTGTDTGYITTDMDVIEAAYRTALGFAMQSAGPALIVIDPGDPARARGAARTASGWNDRRADALVAVDAATARAVRSLPLDAVLLVVSTAQYDALGQEGFGPLLIYGAGPGTVISASTRHEIVTTMPDVTATIASLLGLEMPIGVSGSPLEIAAASGSGEERLAAIREYDERARAAEATRVPMWAGTIAVTVALLVATLVLVLLARPGAHPQLRAGIGALLFVVSAAPAASLAARVLGTSTAPGGVWLRFGLALALVLATALAPVLSARWRHRHDATADAGRITFVSAFESLAVLTVAIICIDQVLGGPGADGSAFSYSALFGTRFFGLGNEGAAVLVGAALVTGGRELDPRGGTILRRYFALGALVLLISVLPLLGANFGVAAWGTTAFVVAYLYARRRRLNARTVIGAVATGVAVVALAVAVEALWPGATHLGRLLGGQTDAGALLQRKLELNLAILTATPIVALLPLALAAIGYLLAKPVGVLGDVLSAHRGAAAALAGGVGAAVVGFVSEDSGVVVSALVMMFPAVAFALRALAREREAT